MKLLRNYLAILFVFLNFVPAIEAVPIPWFAYVANVFTNDVTPINLSNNSPGTNIPVGTRPRFIAITPDGKTAYVTNSTSSNVIPIDIATNTPGLPITVGTNPFGIAITPDGTTAYVTNEGTDDVTPIDLTMSPPLPGTSIPVGNTPGQVAITPNGKTAYVTNLLSHTVTPIDIATNTAGPPIPVGGLRPFGIAITPDGLTAFVVNNFSDNVTPIDIATNNPGPTIPVGSQPGCVAITPDGKTAYVTNFLSGDVTPIDIATQVAGTPFIVGIGPFGIDIAPDGNTAYVAIFLFSSIVIPVDLTTSPPTPGAPIPVGGFPEGIAITPDQAPIATFIAKVARTGLPTQFDASASFSPTGPVNNIIVDYAWDFGDGSMVVHTSDSTISHVYASRGSYTVTLTVTNAAGTSTSQVYTGQTLYRNGGPNAQFSQTIFINEQINPPTHLRGFQIANRFLTQTDLVNILTWEPPTSGVSPVFYRIYRNSNLTQLIAKIPANGKLRYEDHHRKEHRSYTYFVIAVGQFEDISTPVRVTIP